MSPCASGCARSGGTLRVEGPQIARILVAAAVSWELCVWLGATQPPVFAVVVPLVAMRDAPDSALNVSVARLVGVVAGLSIGIAVLSWLRPSAVSVVLVLALALGVGVVLRIGDTLNLQVAMSALLLFANADPAAYAVSRLWETAVGAAVTIVLSPLLLPTNPARAFVRALHGIADSAAEIVVLAADLDEGEPELAHRLDADAHNLDDWARALGPHLAAARRAVRLHAVWRRRHARELDGLVEPTALAPEVTSLIRSHVADALEFSTRADTRDWWQASAPSRRSILLPLSDAVAAALAGTPSTTDVEKARTGVLVYSEADQTRFGVIIRRPLRRMIALLTGSTSGKPSTPAPGWAG
ncbi:MAG: hypothetical protein K0R87_381 [Pseudonocardia sp.]|nr:hypothetical protein [Pseudonocardia sp.]